MVKKTKNIASCNIFAIPVIIYLLCLLLGLSYFFVYVVSMIWFVFVRCFETGELLTGLIVFSLGIASEIGTVKLAYMFLNIGKIRNIVAEILACEASVVEESRFSKNLLLTLRDVKKRAMIFWFVIIGNGFVYAVKPILTPGRHFTEDKFILYGFEPMTETPNYQIALLLMMMTVTFACYLPATITAFLIVITGYVEAQMLALSEELVGLWEDAEKHHIDTMTLNSVMHEDDNEGNKDNTINKYIEEHLKVVINSHGKNISILHQIEQAFRGAIMLEFFLLVIGLIAGLLGGLENTYLEMPYALMQVSMDCFTGQRVMDASVTFERAVYDCKWENYNKSNMKTVIIMLLNSQRTMKLSAGSVIILNFRCLMQVYRSIYSAYTALRTTM